MFSKTPGPTNLFVSLLLEPLKRYEHCPESHVFDAPGKRSGSYAYAVAIGLRETYHLFSIST